MKRPPTEISGDPYFFYRKFMKKLFRGRGPPIDDLGPLFQKSKPEISSKIEKNVFFCLKNWFSNRFLGKLQQKSEIIKISKTFFRKKAIKSRWGGPRPKFRVTHIFFIESSWKKIFEVGGPLSTIWGLYFKSRNPKFLPTRKKRVFRVADFFEKSRKWGFIFEGAPQKFFYKFVLM